MRKQLHSELKELSDQGEGILKVATIGAKDKDNDISLPGFYGRQHANFLPAHDWHHIPLGKGVVYEKNADVLFQFKLNLELQASRDWYSHMKFDLSSPPSLQEISYGFQLFKDSFEYATVDGEQVRYLKARPDGQPGCKIFEVSTVLVGAGVGTGLIDLKEEKDMITPKPLLVPTHQTPTTDHPWDGPLHQRRAKASAEADYYRQLYAWHDGVSDAAQKHGWRFGHHVVAEDGTPGEASVRACVLGIALLNGEKGSSTLSADERQGVYQHLAAHLKDAGIAVPELRPLADEIGVKLDDAVTWVHWEIDSLIARFADLKDTREHKGKPPLTPDRLEQISGLKAKLDALTAVVAEQPAPADAAAAKEVFERFQALQTAINAQ